MYGSAELNRRPSCGLCEGVDVSLWIADAPGVTHQVQPFGPKGDPDDGVQYMRNLGKK